MKKLVCASAVVAFLLAFTAVGSQRAAADFGWCLDDPILTINGKVVHITVAVPEGQQGLVKYTGMVIIVPNGVNASVADANTVQGALNVIATVIHSGSYNGRGPIPVSVQTFVLAPPTLPTRVFADRAGGDSLGQTTGNAMSVMSLSFQVR